jgi:aminobenzoyl-glutamate utilization protein B
VRYYGCPAEEGGAAKTFMVRAGLFDDVDAAISWHPADYTGVFHANSLANTRIDFTFLGRAAHAAGAPELGRSALDAVELMNVGVNYLREHMPPGARVHYAYLDAGGTAPNVVPAKATVRQLIRTRRLRDLNALVARVRRIAEGAALMTETRVEARVVSAVSDLLGNRVLEEAMQANMDRLGPVDFDAGDVPFAEAIRATLTGEHIADTFRQLGRPVEPGLALCDFVVPLDAAGEVSMGSTDVGDVSWAVPTVQAWVATCAIGTPFHSWQLTAQGKMPAAHKGLVHAAKIMAATGRDLVTRPDLLAAAKAEHAAHLAREPYACPLAPEVSPPIPPRG